MGEGFEATNNAGVVQLIRDEQNEIHPYRHISSNKRYKLQQLAIMGGKKHGHPAAELSDWWDKRPHTIPTSTFDFDDYKLSYDTGIKPEIHCKYRQPPLNDPNYTWDDRI